MPSLPSFRIGTWTSQERRNRHSYTTSSREEEEEDVLTCPCGKAKESRTHIAGECEIYKEERDVSEEMRKKKMDVRDMEKFSTSVENSEKTIAILGIGWWSPKAKQERGACAVNGQMTKANK